MQEMSNLDYHFLVGELQALVGERLVKAYLEDGSFRFKIGGKNLLVRFGKGVWLSDKRVEGTEPPAFVMLLRKRLDNARLVSVKQLNFDRIVVLEFDKAERFFVVLEMFGEGNLLLCDEGMRIIAPFRGEEYASRKLRKGEQYVAPPNAKKDVLVLKELPALKKGKLVSALSKEVNLSPFYLEEACARAGLDCGCDASVLEERKVLLASLKSLFEGVSPRVYLEGGKTIAFSPFELKKLEGKEAKLFASFSLALEAFFFSQEIVETESPEAKKLRYLLAQQEAAVQEFERKALESRRRGDAIYASLAVVETALKEKKKELDLPDD